MAKVVAGLSIAYGVLIIVVLFVTAQIVSPSNVENYVKLAGVGIAGLGGLFTFIASAYVAIRANRDLEELKTRGARDTERLKAVLAKYVDAYQTLNTAANLLFDSLSSLEKGTWDPGRYDTARNDMARARASQGLLADDKPFVNLWEQFWQEGAVIGERASKLTEPQDRKALWEAKGASFGGHLKDLQNSQRAAMERLLRDNPAVNAG